VQFIIGVVVGVVGYMFINDPSMLSDLLHSWGDVINAGLGPIERSE
jgi:divalent metal cation (Fe/Co/Zn/Cd) transporter